jgi:hypothetical protein
MGLQQQTAKLPNVSIRQRLFFKRGEKYDRNFLIF